MTIFAHTESGKALQPLENASADEYLSRFTPDVTEGWVVTQVPDGTEHGATPDGHGGWINPSPPAPPQPIPGSKALNKTEFLKLFADNNGDLTLTLQNWP